MHASEALAAASIPGSWHLDLEDRALMLAGMPVEVQLKAILVSTPAIRSLVTAAKPPNASADAKLWKVFYSHNLAELAALANVSLSQEQEQTAAALSQYIAWRGRDVVPTERGIDNLIPVTLNSGLVGGAHRLATIQTARELIELVVAAVKTRLY